MNAVIDFAKAKELVEKAIEHRGGDTTVNTCSIYDVDLDKRNEEGTAYKTPSCLVGQAIYELVGDDEFQNVKSGTVLEPLQSVGYHATRKAAVFLRSVQSEQDSENTWSTAYVHAINRHAHEPEGEVHYY